MAFSTIIETPEVRAIVQDHGLEKKFWDGLYPSNLYRKEAGQGERWQGMIGDAKTMTGNGLLPVKAKPIRPGGDATVQKYPREQWLARLEVYGVSQDTHLPTNSVAAASTLMSDIKAAGLSAGMTLNVCARNAIFRAGLSGWTVCNGGNSSSTAVPVMRLNGFTRARNPNLAGGSVVGYEPVSTANPLDIEVYYGGAFHAVKVTGFSPVTAGDEFGPGTLTIDGSVSLADRSAIRAVDRTAVVRVGGGDAVDAIGSGDKITLDAIRQALTNLENAKAPKFADGTYHFHMSPLQKQQLFADNETQLLFRGSELKPGTAYAEYEFGRVMGCTFYTNDQAPQVSTVGDFTGLSANYSDDDPFPGELYSSGIATGTPINRAVVIADGGFNEYYQDDPFITEAGLQGIVKSASAINTDGIDVMVDRVLVFMRPPQDRVQSTVATTWRFIGDWVFRTDGAVPFGGKGRYKRLCVVESGS